MDAERLEEITEHHERALSAKDEGEARLRNKAIRARSWTVKGPDIKGEAMVLPTEDWDYLIDKGVELAVALAEVERLRGVVAKARALEQCPECNIKALDCGHAEELHFALEGKVHEHRYPPVNGQGFPVNQCLDCGVWK